MSDPAVAFAAGVIVGTLLAGVWGYYVYVTSEKGYHKMIDNLVRQRTHLVGQREALRRDLLGLARTGERAFKLFLNSLTHIDSNTLRIIRNWRATLNRAKKYRR